MAGDGSIPTGININGGNKVTDRRLLPSSIPQGIRDRGWKATWETNQKMHPMAASVMKRRKLEDLTNMKGAARAGAFGACEDAPLANPKDCVNHLIKIIDERNKTLDLMNFELRNFHVALRKSYQQNRELACANNLILGQNNTLKERGKLLLHGLACNKALLKSMGLELKEERPDKEISDKIVVADTEVADEESHLACDNNTSELDKKHTSRNQSLPSTTLSLSHEVVGREEKADKRRRSSRWVAANSGSECCDPVGNTSSREIADIPICSLISETVHEDRFNQLDCSAPTTTSSNSFTDQSLGCTALPHEIEGRGKAARKRKSTRRKYANLSPERCDPVDFMLDGKGVNPSVCPVHEDSPDRLDPSAPTSSNTSKDQSIGSTALLHEIERRDKTDRRRKSLRRTAPNLDASHKNELCSTVLPHQVEEGKKVDGRRKSSRRTADNFASEHCGTTEDLSTKKEVKFPICSLVRGPENQGNELHQLDSLAPCHLNTNMKPGKDDESRNPSGSVQCDTQESHRPSLGRPSRSAARKVISYKELPVNIKMRRIERPSGVVCWTGSNADAAK